MVQQAESPCDPVHNSSARSVTGASKRLLTRHARVHQPDSAPWTPAPIRRPGGSCADRVCRHANFRTLGCGRCLRRSAAGEAIADFPIGTRKYLFTSIQHDRIPARRRSRSLRPSTQAAQFCCSAHTSSSRCGPYDLRHTRQAPVFAGSLVSAEHRRPGHRQRNPQAAR